MSRKVRRSKGMKPKKSATIGSRLDPALRGRLDKIADRYGTTDAVMLDDALSALADYVATVRRYARPMKMVYDWERAEPEMLVAEEQAQYGAMERSEPEAEAEVFATKLASEVARHPFAIDPRMAPGFILSLRRCLFRKMEEATALSLQRSADLRQRVMAAKKELNAEQPPSPSDVPTPHPGLKSQP